MDFLKYLYLDPNWIAFWFSFIWGLFVLFVLDFIIFPRYIYPFKKLNFFLLFLRYFLSLLLIIAISITFLNPQWIINSIVKIEKTLNIQILMDVSLSMAADDIPPSRFEIAKQSLADFVNKLPGYNISVVMFSWLPVMWIPFTDEIWAIVSKLVDTDLWMFPPTMDFVGTALGNALIFWIDNLMKFSTNKEKPGIIILLTDGDSNRWYNPVEVAAYAKQLWIKIYLLAIGKSNYKIALRKDWIYEYTYLNIDNLKKIVDANWWNFYHILSKDDFKQVLSDIKNEIKTQEKKKVEYVSINLNKYIYVFIIFLLIINILFRLVFYRQKL